MRRLAVLALAACGLLPEEDFTGRRAGDGVAPWQELGAIEMCLGETRYVAADREPAGLCVLDGAAAGAACAGDGDCRSREACQCGRCTVTRCVVPEDCAAGRTCRDGRCQVGCAEDPECAAGETCAAGVCRQTCADDQGCQAGEVCATEGLERRCTAVPCAGEMGCRANEECRIQREPHAIAEPSALWEEGVTLWLEIDGSVWRAVSSDGLRFRLDPETPVADGRAPTVVAGPSGYEIWVETPAGLAHGTSADGRSFQLADDLPNGLRAPGAARLADGTLLVLAESGGALVDLDGTPLLDGEEVSDPLFWRQVSALGSPALLAEEGVVKLWFAGHGVESAAAEELGELVEPPPNDSIGYAAAVAERPTEFQPWAFNPVFQRTIAFLTKQEEGAPSVVRLGGRDEYRLYFVGEDGLRAARNPPVP